MFGGKLLLSGASMCVPINNTGRNVAERKSEKRHKTNSSKLNILNSVHARRTTCHREIFLGKFEDDKFTTMDVRTMVDVIIYYYINNNDKLFILCLMSKSHRVSL